MKQANKSIFDYSFRPVYQGLLVLGIYLLVVVFIILLKSFRSNILDPLDHWKFSTSLLLFYIMVSCIFCFSTKQKIVYYRDAVFTYVALILIFATISTWLSEISIYEAESYSWILTVFSIIYIVLLTIINLVRKIVEIAIKQDKNLTDEK